jgi:hypothetical protein
MSVGLSTNMPLPYTSSEQTRPILRLFPFNMVLPVFRRLRFNKISVTLFTVKLATSRLVYLLSDEASRGRACGSLVCVGLLLCNGPVSRELRHVAFFLFLFFLCLRSTTVVLHRVSATLNVRTLNRDLVMLGCNSI